MRKLFLLLLTILLLLPIRTVHAIPAGASQPAGETTPSPDSIVLESSSVTNGDSDVPLDVTIQLNFSANVVNAAVMFENSNCFHLTDENGNSVPIRVIFPDDQLQQTYKTQIFITPQEPLAENSIYSLHIDKTISSKNGLTLDDAHVLTFSASDKLGSEANPILEKLGDNIMSFDTDLPPAEASVPGLRETLSPEPEPGAPNGLTIVSVIVFIVLIAAIACIAILLLIKKHSKKPQ